MPETLVLDLHVAGPRRHVSVCFLSTQSISKARRQEQSLTEILHLCRLSSMDTAPIRITSQTLKVLGALISSKAEVSGADIARSTALSSGTLYPILMRLERSNWIESEW